MIAAEKERALGALLGHAIGDALGSQTEFCKNVKVHDLGPTWGYPFPAFSDDTQMMMAVAEALIEAAPNDQDRNSADRFVETMSANFVRWLEGDQRWGIPNRAPGATCVEAISRLRELGTSRWLEAGITDWGKGNGAVMRVTPIGVYFRKQPVRAFQLAALSSVPTHNNLESLLASGAAALLVAAAVRGDSWREALTQMFEILGRWRELLLTKPMCKDQDPTFAVARLALAVAASERSVAEFKTMNGNDGKAVEALAAAIHANVRHADFRTIVLELANHTGDSDTTAAIGGAIAGARYGLEEISQGWRERVEGANYLHELAQRLFACNLAVKKAAP